MQTAADRYRLPLLDEESGLVLKHGHCKLQLLACLHFFIFERKAVWALCIVMYHLIVTIGTEGTLQYYQTGVYHYKDFDFPDYCKPEPSPFPNLTKIRDHLPKDNGGVSVWFYEQQQAVRNHMISRATEEIPMTAIDAARACVVAGVSHRTWQPGILSTDRVPSFSYCDRTTPLPSTDEQFKRRGFVCTDLAANIEFAFEVPSSCWRFWYAVVLAVTLTLGSAIIDYWRAARKLGLGFPAYNTGLYLEICYSVVIHGIYARFTLYGLKLLGLCGCGVLLFKKFYSHWTVPLVDFAISCIGVFFSLWHLAMERKCASFLLNMPADVKHTFRRARFDRGGLTGFLLFPSYVYMRRFIEKDLTDKQALQDKFTELAVAKSSVSVSHVPVPRNGHRRNADDGDGDFRDGDCKNYGNPGSDHGADVALGVDVVPTLMQLITGDAS